MSLWRRPRKCEQHNLRPAYAALPSLASSKHTRSYYYYCLLLLPATTTTTTTTTTGRSLALHLQTRSIATTHQHQHYTHHHYAYTIHYTHAQRAPATRGCWGVPEWLSAACLWRLATDEEHLGGGIAAACTTSETCNGTWNEIAEMTKARGLTELNGHGCSWSGDP